MAVCFAGPLGWLRRHELTRCSRSICKLDHQCCPLLQTPASHLCGNGMIEMLEMLEDVPLINYNLADNEGNTPLHLAAQGRYSVL